MHHHIVENIRGPLIQQKTFAVYDSKSTAVSLSELSVQLLDEQRRTWPQLAAGYSSLSSVCVREVCCRGYSAWLQFNPGRIVSTSAKLDERSIRERRCFLCVEHLPPLQKGILYKDEFLMLCNPAPIFAEHFTISHVRHMPQMLSSGVRTFLDLARDLKPRLTVFYNGPKCGASAPDHMHFQASPTDTIPVEKAAREKGRRVHRQVVRGVEILTLANFGREVVVLESRDEDALETVLLDLVDALQEVTGSAEEPMMNVVCSFGEVAWRVILFPRSKHRQDAYFKEGEEKVLVSPAAVDIGGLIITPVEKDFNRIRPEFVESMFQEVTLPGATVNAALARLS